MTSLLRQTLIATMFFLAHQSLAPAMALRNCKEVMQLADVTTFENLGDVHYFALDHMQRLELPELMAVANYAATLVEEKPTQQDIRTYKSNIEGVVLHRQQIQMDGNINLQQVASDTAEALAISEFSQWDQHAAYATAEYIEFWADLVKNWPDKHQAEKDALLKHLEPSLERLERLYLGGVQVRTRKSIESILKAFHFHTLERNSKQYWGDANDLPHLSPEMVDDALHDLQKIFIAFDRNILFPAHKNNEYKNATEIVADISAILFNTHLWHQLINERPGDTLPILRKLDEIQRYLTLYTEDDIRSLLQLDIVIHKLHNHLMLISESVGDRTDFGKQVDVIVDGFPVGALSPTMKKERIIEIIRSGYSHGGHNAVLHGRLHAKIQEALQRLERSRDDVQMEQSAWFLFQVIQELHARASIPQ